MAEAGWRWRSTSAISGSDAPKLEAGSASLSADGDLLTVARAIWIELRDAAD